MELHAPVPQRVSLPGGVRAWIATLALVGAAFAALALSAPPQRAEVTIAVGAAAALGAMGSMHVLLRGARMARVGGTLLAVTCLGASGTAAALAIDPPGGAAATLQLGRTSWLLVITCVVLPGVAIRHLIGVLRARVSDLVRMSRTDQVTGVPNRRAWDEELPRELARSLRHGTPLSLA